MDILTIYGWILAWFAVLTAILIGWQLYSVINMNTIIKRSVDDITKIEIDRLRQELQNEIRNSAGKSMAAMHYNIAQTFAFEGELRMAILPFIIAYIEFNKYDKNHLECGNCLKSIREIITIMEKDLSFSIPNKVAVSLIAGLNDLDTPDAGDIINFVILKCERIA